MWNNLNDMFARVPFIPLVLEFSNFFTRQRHDTSRQNKDDKKINLALPEIIV